MRHRSAFGRLGLGMGLGGVKPIGETFSPSDLSTLIGWWDATDITTLYQTEDTSTPVTTNGQSVGRIEDKSPEGNHLTQNTALSRPTYVTSGIGGKPSMTFDGGDFLFDPVSAGS